MEAVVALKFTYTMISASTTFDLFASTIFIETHLPRSVKIHWESADKDKVLESKVN